MEVNVDYEYEGNCGTGMDYGYRGEDFGQWMRRGNMTSRSWNEPGLLVERMVVSVH